MAGIAGCHLCRVDRLSIYEEPEPPAARRGVLFRVFDHKLNVRERPRNKRLGLTEDFVVFSGWDVLVVQSGNDGAVRKWERPRPIGLDRYIAQNRAYAVKTSPSWAEEIHFQLR